MRKISHIIEKILGIYRWHPTIALRYLPIVFEIKKRHLEEKSILEAGSGNLGIAPYLKRQIIGVDLTFDTPTFPLLVPVIGSITAIPFADDSFDVVISTDTIEHLVKSDREKAIYELLRTGKELICIGIPCGEKAQVQDKFLGESYKSTYREEFDFFSEHEKYDLPDKNWMHQKILSQAQSLGKSIKIRCLSTLNLRLRYFLMQGWISSNFFVNILFRKVLLLLIPIFLILNQEPTYRQIFIVEVTND